MKIEHYHKEKRGHIDLFLGLNTEWLKATAYLKVIVLHVSSKCFRKWHDQ